MERKRMELLYHVLPGSDMFGESGRAWHYASPEPFYGCWAVWWWERTTPCSPCPAFPKIG